jgi:hypothetical protein
MKNKLLFILTICTIARFGLSAQDSFEKAEALFIYNFTRYMAWPTTCFSGEFVISVLGDKSLVNELESITSGKAVGANKIILKTCTAPSEITKSHIIIIGSKFRSSTEEIKNSCGDFPSLIINSGDGRITKFAGLGFKVVDDKMRFEMYKNNIKNVGIQVSIQLEKMAIILD